MSRYKAPTVPFVQARNVGGPQKPTAIVLKLSSTTSDRGAALGIASYHHQATAPLQSYHYIVDNETTYRCVRDDVAAYGNLHNAINILICAHPHEQEAMWQDATAKCVMHRAAALVADMMLVHKIKPRYLRGEAEQKWLNHKWRRRGGLIVRVQGDWPYESFLLDVKSQIVIKEAFH